jgi:glycerophosphoryl diester phosphodiesterase
MHFSINTHVISALIFPVLFLFCPLQKKDSPGGVVPGKALYNEYLDVRYGEYEENVLDAYLPEESTGKTKVIVYIHGGSWVQGDKKEFPKQLIEELVGRQKYALASINYRLVKNGNNIFPAQIEDVQKALAFITGYAKEYSYDGNSFALMGASAGAHLALLYAYRYDSLKQVKTVVDIFGPTDLTDKSVRTPGLESNDIITNYLGTASDTAAIAREASPLLQLSRGSGVPTIVFHGTADELVDVAQSKMLYEKLKALEVPAQLELYPGGTHALPPAMAADVFTKIIAWLQKYYPS